MSDQAPAGRARDEQRHVDEGAGEGGDLGGAAAIEQHPGEHEHELTLHGGGEAVRADQRQRAPRRVSPGCDRDAHVAVTRGPARERIEEQALCLARRRRRRAVRSRGPGMRRRRQREDRRRGDRRRRRLPHLRGRRGTAPQRAGSPRGQASRPRRQGRPPGRRRARRARRRASPAGLGERRRPPPAPRRPPAGSPTRACRHSDRGGRPVRKRFQAAAEAATGSCRGCGSRRRRPRDRTRR